MSKRVVPIDSFVTYALGSVNFKDHNAIAIPQLRDKFIESLRSVKNVQNFYFIFHTETDTLHLHYIVYFKPNLRCITFINKISSLMSLETDAIFCDKCLSVSEHLRYILHQSEEAKKEEKKEYPIDDIVTDSPLEVVNSLINSKKGTIDFDYLADVVLRNKFDTDIMRALTLPVYHKYRYEIEKIKDDRSYLMSLREKDNQDDLPF